jgi:hypothetical protein
MLPGLLRNVEISRTGKVSGFIWDFHQLFCSSSLRGLFCAGYIILKELIRNGCEIFVSKISLEAKWTSSLNCNRCSNMSFRQPEVQDYTCAGWALNMVNTSIPFYNPSLHSLYCLSILSTRDSLCVNCEAIHVARI